MNIRKVLLVLLSFLILIIIGYFYENKVSYIHFVDEEENMVSGKYLLNGEKLYSGIFATHQPISYILSAGIQKASDPTSIFLLIKRHREFVIAWSIIWAALLIWRFGFWAAPAILGFEISKIFLLGNLFLPESLVVYPILYLTGISLDKDNIRKIEYLMIGLIFGIVFFLLSPLWPLLLFLAIIFVLNKNKISIPDASMFVLGFAAVFIAVSPFVSWSGYLRDVFEFNTKYYIPVNSTQLSIFTIPKSLFSFLTVFAGSLGKTPILFIIRGISILFTLGIGILLSKRMWKEALGIFLVLGLANLRYFTPGLDYYRGFHLLPWLAVLFFLTAYIFNLTKRSLLPVIGILLVFLSLFYARKELFVKRDVLNDYYIGYSVIEDAGKVISVLKEPGDALFVASDTSLVYWQANIKNFSRYLFFYSFMNDAPFISSEMEKLLGSAKPTFLYCKCKDDVLMKKYLGEYTPIYKDNREVDTFILKSRAHLVSKEQKDYFDFYRYSF